MTYSRYPKPLLGPCRCQDCGEPLYWATRQTRVRGVLAQRTDWRESDGIRHVCPNSLGAIELRTRRINGRVEYGPPARQCPYCPLQVNPLNFQRHLLARHPEPVGVGA
jgi:hypothetical protein